jgi:hypothetical protein
MWFQDRMFPMRLLLLLCALSQFVVSIGAYAQTGADQTNAALTKVPPPSAAPKPRETLSEGEIQAKGAEWHNQCMQDWDRQTHMSKQEWMRACQRVVGDRVQWLRGQGKQ